MSPELERLVTLQDIETRAADAQKTITDAPARIAALDSRLATAREALDAARQLVAANQAARRDLDRDLAAAQQRLGKYKEQLMAVKTNAEYHAMQHQIAAAEQDVARVEEQVLVNMLEADDLAEKARAAEAALKTASAEVDAERRAIEAEVDACRQTLEQARRERDALLPQLDPEIADLFGRLLKQRQGIAVAQTAAGGLCSVCHVRLRPQVYNTVLRNDTIVQCESCHRILYFSGPRERSAAGQAAVEAAISRQNRFERSSS